MAWSRLGVWAGIAMAAFIGCNDSAAFDDSIGIPPGGGTGGMDCSEVEIPGCDSVVSDCSDFPCKCSCEQAATSNWQPGGDDTESGSSGSSGSGSSGSGSSGSGSSGSGSSGSGTGTGTAGTGTESGSGSGSGSASSSG